MKNKLIFSCILLINSELIFSTTNCIDECTEEFGGDRPQMIVDCVKKCFCDCENGCGNKCSTCNVFSGKHLLM